METILFEPTNESLRKAADTIKNGGLVAFPTETVYGLGADAFDPDAARKAYAAKGRPSDNPLIVHIAEIDDIYRLVPKEYLSKGDEKFGTELGKKIKKLSDAFWPGPLTMVLPKLDAVPKETTGGLDTVAVRMPRSEVTLKFIKESKTLVSGPSANLSGRPSPTSWFHVKHDLDGKIDGIICGDPCEGGIESTVLNLAGDKPVILRPGLITPEMISAVLDTEVIYDAALLAKPKLDEKGNAADDPDFHPIAPGMKYKHYAPKAEMILFKGSKENTNKAILDFVKEHGKKDVFVIYEINPRTFFAQLREADEENKKFIVAAALCDDSSISFSVMNRALKAAGYHIVEV